MFEIMKKDIKRTRESANEWLNQFKKDTKQGKFWFIQWLNVLKLLKDLSQLPFFLFSVGFALVSAISTVNIGAEPALQLSVNTFWFFSGFYLMCKFMKTVFLFVEKNILDLSEIFFSILYQLLWSTVYFLLLITRNVEKLIMIWGILLVIFVFSKMLYLMVLDYFLTKLEVDKVKQEQWAPWLQLISETEAQRYCQISSPTGQGYTDWGVQKERKVRYRLKYSWLVLESTLYKGEIVPVGKRPNVAFDVQERESLDDNNKNR